MAGETILVTGGAGYIGAHVCKALAAAGYRPVAYDDCSLGDAAFVQWGPLEQGDIADRARLAEVIRRHKPAAAMHFAAKVYIGASVGDPAPYYETNVAGSIALVETLRAAGVNTLVFSSSCTVFEAADGQPVAEDAPQIPASPYGWSKWMVERMLEHYRVAYGFRSVALRYFNATGADPAGDLGENRSMASRIVPQTLAAAAGLLPGVRIFGTDYATPDGTTVRDYVHVSDLAAAHVAALDKLLAGEDLPAVNLGIGRGFSVREIVAAAERVTGRPIQVTEAARRPGDVAQITADARLAAAVLGFQPRFTDLDAMIATSWAWFQANPARLGY